MDALRVYIGWDQRDQAAYEVAAHTLKTKCSMPVEIVPLIDWKLRAAGIYWRACYVDDKGQCFDERDHKPFSTAFSFTRFAVPLLAREDDTAPKWVLFMDADMMLRADIAELLDYRDDKYAIYCVQHEHEPLEATKGTGMQSQYFRKNWSSFMWINTSHPAHSAMTRYRLNNMTGAWLHSLAWLADGEIGSLPMEWNWLEGWSDEGLDPKNVHFTRGTPDMAGYEDIPYADEWRFYLNDRASRPPFYINALA